MKICTFLLYNVILYLRYSWGGWNLQAYKYVHLYSLYFFISVNVYDIFPFLFWAITALGGTQGWFLALCSDVIPISAQGFVPRLVECKASTLTSILCLLTFIVLVYIVTILHDHQIALDSLLLSLCYFIRYS